MRWLIASGLIATIALWLVPWLRPLPILSGVLLAVSAGSTIGLVLAGLRGSMTSTTAALALALLSSLAWFLAGLFVVRDQAVVPRRNTVGPADELPARPETLRMVDFNVLHGFPGFVDLSQRAEALEASLRALAPDIVLLQESWRVTGHGALAERLGRALGMDVAYARANGSRTRIGFEEGSAVLSRLPIVRARRWVLRPRRPWWETRIAVEAVLDLGDGERLTVVSTHLSHRDQEIAGAQAEDLVTRLGAGGPMVVAGDLNAGSDSRAARALHDGSFDDLLPGAIDHVFLRAASRWRVAAAAWTLRPDDVENLIGRRLTLSDHPGILVDLAPMQAER